MFLPKIKSCKNKIYPYKLYTYIQANEHPNNNIYEKVVC